ncbi:putative phage abortive infection protein [Formosimonas limnophila]|uniref:putative phage abortive infection protein n=1 Tax=Formosimonas limnophila TaxID=1384487 RepID=UPI00167BC830|nr:putative phage abortive infection protein [Formosimonas limnophila]
MALLFVLSVVILYFFNEIFKNIMGYKSMKASIKYVFGFVGVSLFVWLFYKYVWQIPLWPEIPPVQAPTVNDLRGQFGDFFGGVLNPIIGLATVMLALRAYHDEKVKDRETAKTTNFLKMYETYVSLAAKDRHSIKSVVWGSTIVSFDNKGVGVGKSELLYAIEKEAVSSHLKNNDFYKYAPLLRITYHLLKRELIQDGTQKWDNIRFFRAQLTEDELILMAVNCLWDDEGRDGLAEVAKKAGLFKHLKTQLFVSLLKNEADSDGFFNIKITEDKYKANPVILDKK